MPKARAKLTIPLARNLVPGVAIAPRIIIYGFLCVDPHVVLTAAPAIQSTDTVNDVLALLWYFQGIFRVRLVIHTGR